MSIELFPVDTERINANGDTHCSKLARSEGRKYKEIAHKERLNIRIDGTLEIIRATTELWVFENAWILHVGLGFVIRTIRLTGITGNVRFILRKIIFAKRNS
jgi:hypothetical protein